MLGLATTGTVNELRELIMQQKARINSLVALHMTITPKSSLNKKIKFSDIQDLSATIFRDMVPFKTTTEDIITDELDYDAKVTIKELLDEIDP